MTVVAGVVVDVVAVVAVGCCWLLVGAGCWLLVAGCWLLVVGCWLLVVGFPRGLNRYHPQLWNQVL